MIDFMEIDVRQIGTLVYFFSGYNLKNIFLHCVKVKRNDKIHQHFVGSDGFFLAVFCQNPILFLCLVEN